ncbi:MAG TPA: aldehyde dehydrogenase family protein [Candidatus Binatia bacterium]|nr:aldehyde dehydrogenase family protein [Candidatus Binatia bacterium]
MSQTMRVESRSPFQPGDVVAEVDAWSPERVDEGVAAARQAAEEWRRSPAPARANALGKAGDAIAGAADELAELTVREVGKPRGEAAGEVARSISILRYYAQQVLDPDGETYPSPDGNSLLMARRRPRGAVALITPWNFPLAIPLWKAAPALAYGNAVLLKPAPESTGIALRLAELLAPALPEHLFQVAPGDAPTAQALLRASDAVSFTGSVEAGRSVAVAAAQAGIPVQCEMGGQNASIVLADADLELAAGQVAGAAMGYAGQKCTATSRVIVVGDGSEFPDALRAAVEKLPAGDPSEPQVQVGPVITDEARQRVLEAAAQAERDGGRLLTGGRPGDGEGWMVQPTLFDGLPPDAALNQREVFGPFAGLIPARDLAQAVEITNGVRYGLVTSVYTRDLGRALWALERLDTGMVKVNAPTSGVEFYAPFGGEKESSYGPREQGKAARDFYTTIQTFTVAPGT